MRSVLTVNPTLAVSRLGQDPYEMTTQAAGAVFPFVMQQGLRDLRGVVVGMNVLAGGAFVFDPFRAYANGLVTNPNMAIFGSPGQGKSALVKTLLSRMDALSGASRFVAIIDPKGEYIDLAGWLGYQVLSLRPNGGVRLNPLGGDATIEEGATDRRSKLVGALAGQVLDRPLSGLEEQTIWAAVEILGTHDRASLRDLVVLLGEPTAELLAAAEVDRSDWSRSTDPLRRALSRLVDRSLRGMFDGDDSVNISGTNRGVVIDLSSVYGDPIALPLVMVAVTGWLQELRATQGGGRQWIQVFDEAWGLLQHASLAAYLQSAWKLGRTWGVANVLVAHRLSDLRAQADDGTSTVKITSGLVSDTATRVVLRQAAAERSDFQTQLGLSERESGIITDLVRGRHLWQIGASKAVVQHIVGSHEWPLVDTDQQMRENHTGFPASPSELAGTGVGAS